MTGADQNKKIFSKTKIIYRTGNYFLNSIEFQPFCMKSSRSYDEWQTDLAGQRFLDNHPRNFVVFSFGKACCKIDSQSDEK